MLDQPLLDTLSGADISEAFAGSDDIDSEHKLWRGQDLNLRPSGYEPDELPDCSTPRSNLCGAARLTGVTGSSRQDKQNMPAVRHVKSRTAFFPTDCDYFGSEYDYSAVWSSESARFVPRSSDSFKSGGVAKVVRITIITTAEYVSLETTG